MNYRERRLARAERLRGWATKHEDKAKASASAAQTYIDMVPLGQPVLVGHHSERRHRSDHDRFNRNMGNAIESDKKADAMRAKAGNIEAAASRAIYSDDEDAIVKLRERIEHGESIRDMVKAFNASCRKGSPDFAILDEQMTKNYTEIKAVMPISLGKNGEFPSYFTSNLSGNINRNKKRLAFLERKAGV